MRLRRRLTAALAVALLGLAGCQHAAASPAADPPTVAPLFDSPTSDAPTATPTPSPSVSKTPKPSSKPKPKPTPTVTKSTKPRPRPTATPTAFSTYGIGFRIAPGGTKVYGSSGTLMRYEVAVQDGLSESPASVAATVDSILDNTTRGWARSGKWRFQRVSSGTVNFIVELSTAATTNLICGKYGMNPEGVVSCRGGKNVVINLVRWENGTNGTTEGAVPYSPADYRVLVINHEVGHALGHGHVSCSGAGDPAPVMMSQYYGIDGCVPNIWVYSADGVYVTGPSTA